ncbi:cobalamin B12-binding domain-containing protein [Roseisolibacter sp. H3M3-2]|uniref:cobalamin B12-binding domain-containing protein n=1 Tax=Roseisolibacter sp. H3M3-2 TaxID=3031323 RepID=UPI0023D9891B|nr:cobalamin B12-binding domain-containing protein [Roseisolibacter sp. H3M3-2]MDF1501849.1 cobalamin B12-binding domain-containing protein [Roseisolibacter sp. H3M3-2]
MSNVESRTAASVARYGPHHDGGTFGAPSFWRGDAALAATIERDLVPRLLLAHRAGPFTPFERAVLTGGASVVCAGDREEFVDLVLGPDEDAARRYVAQLLTRGISVEAVYLDLLAPTAVHLGHLWETDDADFLEVTAALGRVQRALHEAAQRVPPLAPEDTHDGRVLLSCLPGEQHTLGLAMVAEFFVRDGWTVELGSPTADHEFAALMEGGGWDVVGLSVASESSLLTARRLIATARRLSTNPSLVVLVGGRVFAEHPDLVARVGADGCAAVAAGAPELARTLLARRGD